ncbi:hypothetical protein A3A76_04925 [Candidatus Woesebacteria bacterium RIFCSPLOWO2_01_FULL_39_23]|uniref:Cohesin domain protein n=2 Tax=Microgenomates group TaxID=1794810 RepID=A0A0H4T6A7_9BACT|nr:Cohesin domain protein [uncultured Microgenomates bacterium Rifle_16ft_4_minimus_37633]OGM13826.1 MAG: hypothetical protein A2141_04150 [Candidatus Woesebacteria bacterium RBG_16_40_11]OGM27776.1 MAG: hypothetical protein A2628_05145 [Candidatus Woesebacteria bacterium RIFCSPHIGHO2_01_FULL_40_22]OGM36210.1 MAG: hypothetical protein A3E41_00865 [Candidatus Woesebacteria bacterium RIFCSPHIGHO2_12_FULL_38_9]OGM62198.1 MAG: hypothetical protein A3A76_04925 [Candidatus Woesebacteria bacterium RIF
MNIFRKGKKIPTITGIFVLLMGLVAGVVAINSKQIFRLGALEEISPKNIRISNINDTSITISWTTTTDTQGFIRWGEKPDSLNKSAFDSVNSDLRQKSHYIKLNNLTQKRNYYYSINSNGYDFDNDNLPWIIQTGPKLDLPTLPQIIYGSIISTSGEPEKNAIVFATVNGGSLLSTVTEDDGTWVIPLSLTRKSNLKSYVIINPDTTPVDINVQSDSSIALATIFPASAKPVPAITLGEVYDFKNITPINTGNTPSSDINIGEDDSSTPVTASDSGIFIENLKDGETLDTTNPEFFGGGPPNKSFTITVESDPVTGTVATDSDGKWDWTAPKSLEEGEHNITLSWTDENGVLQKINKKFSVEAQNVPTNAIVESPTIQPELNISTPEPKKSTYPFPTILSDTRMLIGIGSFILIFVIIFIILRLRRKKTPAPTPLPHAPNQNGSQNTFPKILISLGVIILISATAYLGYQVYINRTKPSLVKTPEIAEVIETPTVSPILSTAPEFTPTIEGASPTPTIIPTSTPKIISPTPALKPTSTPTPAQTSAVTPTPTPTRSVIVSPTSPPPTTEPLPIAGFGLPSTLMILMGSLLFIFSLAILL